MRNKLLIIGIVLAGFLVVSPVPGAYADLVYDQNIVVLGTGLGAVNTLTTGNATGGDTLESFGINQDGSFTPLLGGLDGGDNLGINQVLSFTNDTSFGAVVNIAETGQDLTVTLTDLYLTFSDGTTTYTAFYTGADLDLTQGTGTGIGGSGFVFRLDDAQAAIVAALGENLTVSGGVQFADGSVNDGPETVFVVRLQGNQVVPEPGTLMLLGGGLVGLALYRRKTFKR